MCKSCGISLSLSIKRERIRVRVQRFASRLFIDERNFSISSCVIAFTCICLTLEKCAHRENTHREKNVIHHWEIREKKLDRPLDVVGIAPVKFFNDARVG